MSRERASSSPCSAQRDVSNRQLVPGARDGSRADDRDQRQREQLGRLVSLDRDVAHMRALGSVGELRQAHDSVKREARGLEIPIVRARLRIVGILALWLCPAAVTLDLTSCNDGSTGCCVICAGVRLRQLVRVLLDEVHAAEGLRVLVEHGARGEGR